jgi:low affinity Fe/Cu permease
VRPTKSTSLFTRFAKWTARATGRPTTFVLAATIVVVWGVTGPLFKFSDTWQLVINTGTTIVTFLMVFLIQNTQNRDTEALQVKLDELIRVTKGAHLVLLDLEELDDTQLDRIHEVYEKLASDARKKARRGEDDTGTPDLGDEGMNEAIGDGQGNRKKGKGKKKS